MVCAMRRWLAPPWLGSTESQRLRQCDPAYAEGVGVPSPSPHTARAGRTPDMFHVPPYAMSMNETSLFSSSVCVAFAYVLKRL